MASKKIKLLSGLLSFTAIASMTGAPVLANEFLQNPLSGSETQDEKRTLLQVPYHSLLNRKMLKHQLKLSRKRRRKKRTADSSW